MIYALFVGTIYTVFVGTAYIVFVRTEYTVFVETIYESLFVGEIYRLICGDRIYNDCVNRIHIVLIMVTLYAGFGGHKMLCLLGTEHTVFVATIYSLFVVIEYVALVSFEE